MRKLGAILAVALVAAGVLSGGASAKKLTLPTYVRIDSTQPTGTGQYTVGGQLEVKPACRLLRTVTLRLVHPDGSAIIADTQTLTHTGTGLFSLTGTLAPGDAFVVVAERYKYRLKSGRVAICLAGSSQPVYPAG